ncbi:MAG: serine--tRNA ligase, partial [Proteobacteria bacterium]|nr:serine--tRNA ligase [Pseudomonadota bacterium]
DLLMRLPNLAMDDVPEGKDENDNIPLVPPLKPLSDEPRNFNFKALEHFEIPAVSKGMDFETAGKLSGSRFVLLSGAVARVHRALAQFMLDLHIDEHELTEINTPVIVNSEAMRGTGQLPKFAEDCYFYGIKDEQIKTDDEWWKTVKIKDESETSKEAQTNDDKWLEHLDSIKLKNYKWLIPTSEVPLTNIVAGKILDNDQLPLRYCAHSLCFRQEAGSAGRDTTGMLRQHQFEKVEMVSITHPKDSRKELDLMTERAQTVLKKLDLAFRTVVLCTGDMGFSAQRTHDIEVWLPGQSRYREISSVSVCGDFQARRMNARFREKDGDKPQFVHTLNGSGVAVGRCLIAVLENGQQKDGSVKLPKALHPYLGGKDTINPDGILEKAT